MGPFSHHFQHGNHTILFVSAAKILWSSSIGVVRLTLYPLTSPAGVVIPRARSPRAPQRGDVFSRLRALRMVIGRSMVDMSGEKIERPLILLSREQGGC